LAEQPESARGLLNAAYRHAQTLVHPDRTGEGDAASSALSALKDVLKNPDLFGELYQDLKRSTPIAAEIAKIKDGNHRASLHVAALREVVAELAEEREPDRTKGTAVRRLRNCSIDLLDIDRGLNQGAGQSLYDRLTTAEESNDRRTAGASQSNLKCTLRIEENQALRLEYPKTSSDLPNTILVGTIQIRDIAKLLETVGLSQMVPSSTLPQADRSWIGPTASEKRYQTARITPEAFERMSSFFSPFLERKGDRHAFLVGFRVPEGKWTDRHFRIIGRVIRLKDSHA
jgi:hypothetical protein